MCWRKFEQEKEQVRLVMEANGRRAQREAEAARRAAYAQEMFTQLNAQVFKGGLPPETPLVWNAKMTSTAGRARYHR